MIQTEYPACMHRKRILHHIKTRTDNKTADNLKAKVIYKAVEEINRVALYRVSYSYAKKGRAAAGIIFHVNMVFH